MIAALPMYDWPEARDANDAFWARVAGHLAKDGIAAPRLLTRDRPAAAIWRAADLLLAQTCGLPLVRGLCGTARVVARPDYGIEGASDGTYRSALVCRRGAGAALQDFRGARAAINEYGSQSGCNALADAAGGTDFFASVLVTGAHRASALAVADGAADVAAIDAVAWALFHAHEAEAAASLAVLDWTRAMPALPFIAGASRAGLGPALAAALDAAARGGPGLPIAVAPARMADYAPVARMARALAGRRLAPGTPALASAG